MESFLINFGKFKLSKQNLSDHHVFNSFVSHFAMAAFTFSSLINAFGATFQLVLVLVASLTAMLSLLPPSLLSYSIFLAESSLFGFRSFFRYHSNSQFVFAYALKFLVVFSDAVPSY